MEELEKMIEDLKNEIIGEGYHPETLELLNPHNEIKVEEFKKDFQRNLDTELEEKIKEINSIKNPEDELNDFEKTTEFHLVSNEKREKLELNTRLDIVNKRLDDIGAFLGDESDHILQKGVRNFFIIQLFFQRNIKQFLNLVHLTVFVIYF